MQAKLETKIKSSTVDASGWLITYVYNRWGKKPHDAAYERLISRVERSVKMRAVETKTGDVLHRPGAGLTTQKNESALEV